MMSDYQPEDLLTHIFLLLPVISLLRCKAVCKSWFSLISSQAFIKSHLEKTGVEETLLICRDSDNSMYACHPHSLQCGPPLGLPADLSFAADCRLVGSYNGVVCVSVIQDVSDCFNFNDRFYRDIYLWNPATKKSKLVPPHSRSRNFIKSVTMGFGFDFIGNDFKVVRVVMFDDGFASTEVEVFSAKRNGWGNVEQKLLTDYRVQYHKGFDICLNGLLCSKGRKEMIVFDLSQEVFNCAIKLPDDLLYVNCITNFNDSIAVVRSFGDEEIYHKIKLWTLDDERCLRDGGVEASWTHILSIDVGQPILFVLGYINSCDLVLTGYHDASDAFVWLSCNTEEKEVRNFPESLRLFQVIKYKESLFSLG